MAHPLSPALFSSDTIIQKLREVKACPPEKGQYVDWNIVLSVIAGLATAIPLVIKLVQYVEKAVREKNWNKLLELVMSLMEQAEQKFADGATRREWVLAMVKASADTINYDVDMEAVAELIDSLCSLTKTVNAPVPEVTA